MPSVAANGVEIAYEVRGAGPPLIALHGATSLGLEDFAAQLPLLAKAFLVHLPDARGHGGTSWDAANAGSRSRIRAGSMRRRPTLARGSRRGEIPTTIRVRNRSG